MLKLRLMGRLDEIHWFRKMLEKSEDIQVEDISEAIPTEGGKYFRAYGVIRKNTTNNQEG